MTVRLRLLLGLTLIVAIAALTGAAGTQGLQHLSARYTAAEEQYAELRSLYEVGHRAATVRLLLNSGSADRQAMVRHLEAAAEEARNICGEGAGLAHDLAKAALSMSDASDGDSSRPAAAPAKELRADVNGWLARVATLAAAREKAIVDNRRGATMGLQRLEGVLGVLLLVTVMAATIVGVMLYRAIVGPLGSLNRAMNEIAGNRYQHRIKERGDREFRRLIRHFNRMSEAIQGLHSSMAAQVEMKSRQLIRSEQLAGVGSLAAGVAHEINNPLAIIAGYAQTAIRRLDAADEAGRPEAIRRARSTLKVVCEETFRCRDIAAKLMDLARPAEGAPGLVAAPSLVRRAMDLVGALPAARERELVLRCEQSEDDLVFLGHASQLLQVLINLLMNALEACPAETGCVTITLWRAQEATLITVADNGRGMDQEKIAHAFEPFFTDKPRRGLKGCGLGLSVSHAIIERHRGRLYAHSDGPGRGSIFTIELPLADGAKVEREEVALA